MDIDRIHRWNRYFVLSLVFWLFYIHAPQLT